MNSTEPDRWPQEIRLSADGRTLKVQFGSGGEMPVSAELLRVESPSAEVKGHGPGQEVLVTGKEHVRIVRIEPVGSYAIRLIFDDGHQTGIYTWNYLWTLCHDGDQMLAAYRRRVSATLN